MKSLFGKIEGDHKYEVFFDYYVDFDMYFENEEEKQAYIERFNTGELSSYVIVKSKFCPCCNHFNEIGSTWGIHASSPEEALNDYLECFC